MFLNAHEFLDFSMTTTFSSCVSVALAQGNMFTRSSLTLRSDPDLWLYDTRVLLCTARQKSPDSSAWYTCEGQRGKSSTFVKISI